MKPLAVTNASNLFNEINQLHSVGIVDEVTFARLQRDIKKLLKIDAFNAYLLLGAVAGLKHDLKNIHKNYQAALNLASINEDKAMVLQNYATILEWNGYVTEAAKLMVESYNIFPSTYYAQRVASISAGAGLFHQSANFVRQCSQKLQEHDYHFIFQIEQFMEQHGVSDEMLQQLIEIAIAVLHKQGFFSFRDEGSSVKFLEDESERLLYYTIEVKRSMAEVVDLNYELAHEIAKSNLPPALTLNFIPVYEVA
jgi:hypothetical protein